MTKRRPKGRDFDKYPPTPTEMIQLRAHMRRVMRQRKRAAKEAAFLKRARANNKKRGISPKKLVTA